MLMVGLVDYAELSLLVARDSVYRHDENNSGGIKFTKTLGELVADLAFLKKSPRAKHLSDEFKLGLQSIIDDGSYIAILERYWGKGNIPKEVLFDKLKPYGTDNFKPAIMADLLN